MAEVADYAVPLSQMTLVDWLDDLTVRFLLNLPAAELSSVPRLCFQVEEAQWFYEDFIRPANPQLPSLNLRQFCMTLFQHCPLLSGFNAAQHLAAYEEFLAYKVRVPVRGAILMDQTMDKVLLVRGWKKGASWSFPRGKINKNERDIDCAVREVYEETGFDIDAAGLVQLNEENGQVKAIDVTMREQHMKLFVFRGVPLDTYFEPKTRKEISKIQWYNVKDLPGYKKNKGGPGNGQGEAQANKFYMVAPFLGHLKRWISQQRKRDIVEAQMQHRRNVSASDALTAGVTEDEGDTEAYAAPEYDSSVPATSADELKKLLSIGQDPTNPLLASQQFPLQDQSEAHTADLLSMLKGGQQSGHTLAPVNPLERQERSLPYQYPDQGQSTNLQPQQLLQQQQLLSQFFSPSQHSRHGYPAAATSSAGPGSFQSSQDSATHAAWQAPQSARPGSGGFNNPMTGQIHSRPVPELQQQPYPPNVAMANTANRHYLPQQHSPFAPITGSPQVPEASNLPTPKLNAHSMNLLNSFKSTGSTASGFGDQGANNSTQKTAGGQQKAALLELFKKAPSLDPQHTDFSPDTSSSRSPVNATTSATLNNPAAPNLGDRRLTANEITRTLPFIPKPKASVRGLSETQGNLSESSNARFTQPEKTQIRSLQPSPLQTQFSAGISAPAETHHIPRDAGSPKQADGTPLSNRRIERAPRATAVSTLPRPSSGHANRSLEPVSAKVSQENSSSLPQFSILQRPGSSTSRSSRPSAPQSPLRNEARTSTFQPQVLKRPTSGSGSEETIIPAEQAPKSAVAAEKTDQLLALFGKTSASASGPQQSSTFSPNTAAPGRVPQRDALLNLFSSGNTPQGLGVNTTTPPPAPQLAPERNPSRSQSNRPHSQQHLLNLFSVQNANNATSPSTPISPFSLSTPVAKAMPGVQQRSETSGEARSRLGSIASMVSNGTNSGRQTPTPATATPTEAKGFLMDYLNGVVKEGYRGAKRSGG